MANALEPSRTVCPYSIYSTQSYIFLPFLKIGQLIKLPTLLCYLLAISAQLLSGYMIRFAARGNYVKSISHYPLPDHPHSSATTLGVIIRSTILSALFYVGLSLIFDDDYSTLDMRPIGLYLILLSFYHFSEYFIISITNPSTLDLCSFLLNPNLSYNLAVASSFIEFGIESYLFPGYKRLNLVSILGLAVTISGEMIRKIAMLTAGESFSHIIARKKDPNHKLITHGIYNIFRHPSYAGWFYWALGCQILLLNPICFVTFSFISYSFFKTRISYEESTLIKLFGADYMDYQDKVNLWMPIRL